MPNWPVIIELLTAAGIVGATIVPINTRFKPRELSYLIADPELTALFTTDVIDEHVNFKTLLARRCPVSRTPTIHPTLRREDAPHLRGIVHPEQGEAGFLER